MQTHFSKHAGQFSKLYGKNPYTLKDYLSGAQEVINTGTKVTFTSGKHVGTVNYIRFAGSSSKGRAMLELVGVNNEGKIVTYTLKKAKQLNKWGMQVIQ